MINYIYVLKIVIDSTLLNLTPKVYRKSNCSVDTKHRGFFRGYEKDRCHICRSNGGI